MRKIFSFYSIASLAAVMVSLPVCASSDSWVYKDGVGSREPLCGVLLDRLNRYAIFPRKKTSESCPGDVIASYSGFIEPSWRDLDVVKNADLLFKLFKYNGEGPEGYFKTIPGLGERQPDSVYRANVRDFVEKGGRIRLWKTSDLIVYGEADSLNLSKEQVVVQMGVVLPPSKKESCGVKPREHWMGGVFLVKSDLSGPDPRVGAGAFEILSGSEVFIYKGKPVIVYHESVYRANSIVGIDGYCDFEFSKRGK
ncbi:hypothetical protein ACQUJO_12690 [Ralstonia pseudosolanacearum]